MHRGVPYAFWHAPLPGLPPGYPVFLDINLSQQGAQTWLSWLQEGLLLGDSTRGLLAHLVTYNAELGVFGAVQLLFDFQPGGSIKVHTAACALGLCATTCVSAPHTNPRAVTLQQVSSSIYTLSLELYTATPANLARYAFEVLLAGGIVLLVGLQLVEVGRAVATARGRRRGGLTAYLSHGDVWLRLANNALLLAGVGLWWTFVNRHAKLFGMELRYPVSMHVVRAALAA
jgi:hypothetical protein